ncbi:hypothetical protein ACFQX6_29110 [Streptosporangium lutulentum]
MLVSTAGVQAVHALDQGRRSFPRRFFATGHGVFAVAIAFAAALRCLVMLGYDTAQLYWYDSFTYLDTAVHLQPSGAFHPAGYSFFLRLLLPFHSVELVAGVQHVMGLGMALMIYLVLRRRSLPGWGRRWPPCPCCSTRRSSGWNTPCCPTPRSPSSSCPR